MSSKNMKSMKVDSCSDILSDSMTRIDYLVRENRLLQDEVKSIRKEISIGQVLFDPKRSLALTPQCNSVAKGQQQVGQQKDCYNKLEGKYNKSER